MAYYDGTKLLSLTDINGEKPVDYLTVGNRGPGKTFFYSRMMINQFLNNKGQFVLINRFPKLMKGIGESFSAEVIAKTPRFKGLFIDSESEGTDYIQNLYINKVGADKKKRERCGFAVAINGADDIRHFRPLFREVNRIFFDEFQSENGHYCTDEITKFLSVRTTILNGRDYIPTYYASNAVTMINPYFTAMEIGARLTKSVKFLRGDGWVLEQFYSEESADKIQKANRSFKSSRYLDYAAENVYLNDDTAFIEKPDGVGTYLCTLIYNGEEFGLRKFPDVVYCTSKADKTFKKRVAITIPDTSANAIHINQMPLLTASCRNYFFNGQFRFEDLKSKIAIFALMGVSSGY